MPDSICKYLLLCCNLQTIKFSILKICDEKIYAKFTSNIRESSLALLYIFSYSILILWKKIICFSLQYMHAHNIGNNL